MSSQAMPEVLDQSQWERERRNLLEAEKDLQAARDKVAADRRALGCYRLPSEYEFHGEDGVCSLAGLFGEHSQLIVYHFMYHPDWDEGCKSCSFWADSFDAAIGHLAARNVGFAVISRAPIEKLLRYRERMGWTFPWYSSSESTFNFDLNVSFSEAAIEAGTASYNYREGSATIAELPGLSVFYRDDADVIYHSYSTYARGLDPLNPVYQLLDLVPAGRDEAALPYPMDWVRRHDEY